MAITVEAIRAAHRTGRGEWYAVIELARASRDHPYVWEHITAVHEKCQTRKAAVEAGRRLMAEKAKWVGPDMEISVNVRSALEWAAGGVGVASSACPRLAGVLAE